MVTNRDARRNVRFELDEAFPSTLMSASLRRREVFALDEELKEQEEEPVVIFRQCSVLVPVLRLPVRQEGK